MSATYSGAVRLKQLLEEEEKEKGVIPSTSPSTDVDVNPLKEKLRPSSKFNVSTLEETCGHIVQIVLSIRNIISLFK